MNFIKNVPSPRFTLPLAVVGLFLSGAAVLRQWNVFVALLTLCLLGGLLIATVVALPRVVETLDRSAEDRKSRNDVRTALLQAFGSLLLIGGAITAFTQLRTSQQELKETALGQQAERFSRAVEQLEADTDIGVRLGGIFTLEQLADQEETQRAVVGQILAAYVQRQAQAPHSAPQVVGEDTLPLKVTRPDIQACLNFLAKQGAEGALSKLLLDRVVLPGVELAGKDGAQLEFARLRGANLTAAKIVDGNLGHADLTEAVLSDGNLRGADLHEAFLGNVQAEEADFSGAKLAGADLSGANLRGADLAGANLENADLVGADLSAVKRLNGSLAGTDLRHADLRAADLRSSQTLLSANLTDAKCDGRTLLKAGGPIECAHGLFRVRAEAASG